MQNIKNNTNKYIYNKAEADLQIQKTNHWLSEWREEERETNRGMGLRNTSYYV